MIKFLRYLSSTCVLFLCGAGCGGKASDFHQMEASGGAIDAGSPDGGAANAGAPSDADAGAEFDVCVSNSDCQLLARGCCTCGTGPLSGFAAINRASRDAFNAEQCSPSVNCGPCPPIVPNLNAPESYYIATCEAGRCVALDVRTESLTGCTDNSDCRGRSGTDCCDVCSAQTMVTFNKSAEPQLQTLLCATGSATCVECGRATPPAGVGVFAHCEGGKCILAGGCNRCSQ